MAERSDTGADVVARCCLCVAAGITAMAWSVEERLLVVGTHDGTVAVWDTEEHQVIRMHMGHTGEACKVGFVNFVIKIDKVSGRLCGSVGLNIQLRLRS